MLPLDHLPFPGCLIDLPRPSSRPRLLLRFELRELLLGGIRLVYILLLVVGLQSLL
jgi:hypothetical protein